MATRPMTGNPSQLIVEQLAESGVKYVFYNSGSREAPFFDALHESRKVHGILGLHEGTVTAMAGGYSQAKCDPAVMVVHLGAGLAQCLGQLINVWAGSLPVVVITFAGDTGSFADRIGLDLSHNAGPTSIAAPFTKANWTVIEPEGLPAAVERALRVASTPPVGPVHLAIYDRLLNHREVQSEIVGGALPEIRAGYPSDGDLEKLALALHAAERPLIYVGDGVWKSRAEEQVTELAERFGAAVASTGGDLRSVTAAHPQHCGRLMAATAAAISPDLIVSIGVRHGGSGHTDDYAPFRAARRVMALGSDVDNLTNMPGLELAILADERRALERLRELIRSEYEPARYDQRRAWARGQAAALRAGRRKRLTPAGRADGRSNPTTLLDALQGALERRGGGLITTEQFAAPLDAVNQVEGGGSNVYIRPAGGSEGFGMGAPIGAKLAAPEKPVVGLVGDGSMYYADSALWTTVHHRIPVLYVIANNGTYGIVASSFGESGGTMKQTGTYAGVVLDGIDPVKIAQGFGVEGTRVDNGARLADEMDRALGVVEKERRPYLLDVTLPLGLPEGGKGAQPYRLVQ